MLKVFPRCAFTLIEVLVVVAIIALLMAVLLPALKTARAAGRTSVCASNERQFGVAVNMWAIERDGVVPRGAGYYWSASGELLPTINWTQLVVRMLGDKKDYRRNCNHVPIDTYEVFQCPERTSTYPGRFLDYVINALDHRGPLDANCQLAPSQGKWIEVVGVTKMKIWKRPSEVVYIMDAAHEKDDIDEWLKQGRLNLYYYRQLTNAADGDRRPGLANYDLYKGMQLPAYPQDLALNNGIFLPRAALKMHGGGSNAVFVDGHVELIKAPARKSWQQVMQYYLVKFGIFSAAKENITAYRQGGDIEKCGLGDYDYEY